MEVHFPEVKGFVEKEIISEDERGSTRLSSWQSCVHILLLGTCVGHLVYPSMSFIRTNKNFKQELKYLFQAVPESTVGQSTLVDEQG